MKQLGLAFHNYTDVNREFPKNIYDEEGKPLLSWRVRLLPYMEENILKEEFHLDEPWDSEHNKKLIDRIPPAYISPDGSAPLGKTRYLALAGKETLFPGNEKLSFRNVSDGTSKTIMFVRAAPQAAVPWTKPADIAFNPKKPKASLESPRGYFLALFNDGHVQNVSLGAPDETIKALATRAGGEPINWDEF